MKRFIALLSMTIAPLVTAQSQPYSIAPFAGADRARDGQQAVGTPLRSPAAAVVDKAGNLYIADPEDYRVRKVDTKGVITTVAGTGWAGFSGDGQAGKYARVDLPMSLALDDAGNLYISDADNHRIRKVDASTGIISTVVNLTRSQTNKPDGAPFAVAVDKQGNLYFYVGTPELLDITMSGIRVINSSYIRKLDVASGVITTIAGSGYPDDSGDGGLATKAEFGLITGMTFDAAGNLYICDSTNYKVRKIGTDGIISHVAGTGRTGFGGDGGQATAATIDPWGIAADATGNLYIGDHTNNRVRKIDAKSGVISTVAGKTERGFSGDGGPAAAALLANPTTVMLDAAGVLWVADSLNGRVRKITGQGTIDTVAGGPVGDGSAAFRAFLNRPSGMAMDPSGNLFVADTQHHRIRRIDRAGAITTIAGRGYAGYSNGGSTAEGDPLNALFNAPAAVAVDSSGTIYIADTNNHRIRKIKGDTISTFAGTGEGGHSGDGGPAAAAKLAMPTGIAVDAIGNVFVAEWGTNYIRKITPDGKISTVAGNGEYMLAGDDGPATQAQLSPFDIALDREGNIYVADDYNNRIRKINASTGIITTVAGSSQGFGGDGGPALSAKLNTPRGIAVDDDGNLYIADWENFRVRRVAKNGVISTIAGTGGINMTGDGGPAVEAQMDAYRIVLGTKGELYVSDYVHDVIRMLALRIPSKLSISSGDGQTGTVGLPVSEPLAVLVADASGVPMEGVAVSFTVVSGEAKVDPTQAATGKDGVARTKVTLGPSVGESLVQAAVAGLTPVDFRLTAVVGGPPAVTLLAEPTTIAAGGSATLSWTTSGADKVVIDPNVGEVATSGSKVVTPPATTTYVVTATGPGGSSTASVKLIVTARIDTVVNAKDPGAPLSAGMLATIQGANLAAETLNATTPELPTVLGGTSVAAVDGRVFPLQSVSPSEVTFVLADLPGGQSEVWLQVKKENGEDSDWVRVDLVPASGAIPDATAGPKHKTPHTKPVLRLR